MLLQNCQLKTKAGLMQGRDNLHIVLMGRFCNFFLKQNRELQYASERWPSRSVLNGSRVIFNRKQLIIMKNKGSLLKRRRFAAPRISSIIEYPVLVFSHGFGHVTSTQTALG